MDTDRHGFFRGGAGDQGKKPRKTRITWKWADLKRMKRMVRITITRTRTMRKTMTKRKMG
jgi:hypothetical protein